MNEPELPILAKRLFMAFIATLFVYITVYGGCQAWRRRGGPWNITYALATDGVPELRIEHPRQLGPEPVTLRFPGESPQRMDLPITAVFSVPITNNMPFGPVLFVDTTFLPGTVALNCFGHVVELVPRTLFIDFKAVPWTPGTNIVLHTDKKPPADRVAAADQTHRRR